MNEKPEHVHHWFLMATTAGAAQGAVVHVARDVPLKGERIA